MSSKTDSDVSASDVGIGAWLLLLLIEGYRLVLSPILGGHCRFWPSCSAYAQGSIQRHGALRGSGLAIRRLMRCHPFSTGGVDPVP